MSGTERTIFGSGDGVMDGRALTDTDLNAISNNLTRRAWEVPGYADIVALDQMQCVLNGEDNYDAVFVSRAPYTPYGRIAGLFTRGGGLRLMAYLHFGVQIGAGVLGAWNQSAGAQTPPAQNGVGNMLWAWMNSGTIVTHDTPASGSKRWDIVVVTLSEVDVAAVTRNFKDYTTGVKSSQSVVASKLITVSAPQIVKGIEVSDGTEFAPNIPSGTKVLYAVHVGDYSIENLIDLTIPVGPMRQSLVPGSAGLYFPTKWSAASGHVITTSGPTGRDILLLPPDGVAGNGEARVLGCRLNHRLATGSTVSVVAMTVQDALTPTLLESITTVTVDGSEHSDVIDFRRFLGGGNYGPYWGNGSQSKGMSPIFTSLALHVTAADGSTNSYVYSVEWFSVGG